MVVVDAQERLLPAIRNHNRLIERIRLLADLTRTLGLPTLVTEHCPDRIGRTDRRLKDLTANGEIFKKVHFDACRSETFLDYVKATDRDQWVVTGTEAHICVLQTALSLIDHGSVFVVADAVGTRHQGDLSTALQRLRDAGAQIVSTEMVAFEWLGRADHPAFRETLARIKQLEPW